MVQTGYITQAQADAAGKLGLGLHPTTTPLQSGCTSDSAADAAFFCDFVLASMKVDPAYKQAYKALNTVGGLKIYTTLNPKDQTAAQHAVNFVEPPGAPVINPGHNVDTEVLMQPGTGYVRAIAVNRPYGNGPGHTTIDYAAETQYDGGQGVQTGSSSKLFTLVTALKQGVPFGFTQNVVSPSSIGPYFNCKNQPTECVQRGQRRGQHDQARDLHALQRDHAVHQRVLRPPGAEGRPVQRGADRVQHGPDLRQRPVAAQAGQGTQPAGLRGQQPVVHARLGTRGADEHGRGLRHGRRPRHLLQTRSRSATS